MTPRATAPALLIALLVFSVSLLAQPKGYIEIPQLRHVPESRLGCYIGNVVIDAEKLGEFEKSPNCKDILKDLSIDFERETLVHYSVGSDCHMSIAIKALRSDADKRYKIIIDNIYGGCRAGGTRKGWVAVEKLRPGYNMEVVVVMVDRIHERSTGDGFVYPKPPSIKKSEALETREVDVMDCLPLSGQSRWILIKEAFLGDALARAADKAACAEHFKRLNIDFEKQTLVGYSFSSGHCGRPPGLEFSAVKETSSDPTENRFVLKIGYDDPGKDYCKVWSTSPLWVIVPKLPAGYGFEFDARPHAAK